LHDLQLHSLVLADIVFLLESNVLVLVLATSLLETSLLNSLNFIRMANFEGGMPKVLI